MISEKQLLAARANGAKSHGPKTPQGKARSSQNAIRHGMLANCIVLRGESREDFVAACKDYWVRFDPRDEVEISIVEEMVAAAWRIRRLWVIEKNMFDSDTGAQARGGDVDRIRVAFGNLASGLPAPVLHRYESRLLLMEQRAFSKLAALRKSALRNEPGNPFVSPTTESAEPSEPSEPSPIPNQSADSIDQGLVPDQPTGSDYPSPKLRAG